MPSFSFIEADLAKRQLLVGVLDGTLKVGCSNSMEVVSVHIIDMDLLFCRYFFINVKSIILQIFSFVEADLAMRQLLIGVLDGTLKIGCSNSIEDISVHIIDMDILFHVTSLLILNQS